MSASYRISNNNLTQTKKRLFSFLPKAKKEAILEKKTINQLHDLLVNQSGAQSGFSNAKSTRELYPGMYMGNRINLDATMDQYKAQSEQCEHMIQVILDQGYQLDWSKKDQHYKVTTPKGNQYTFQINSYIDHKIDTTFYTAFGERPAIDNIQNEYRKQKGEMTFGQGLNGVIQKKKQAEEMTLAERIEETVTGGRGYLALPRGSFVDETNPEMKETIFCKEPYKAHSQADFQLFCMDLRDQGYLPFVTEAGTAIYRGKPRQSQQEYLNELLSVIKSAK